jgi:general secretion pathway protein D
MRSISRYRRSSFPIVLATAACLTAAAQNAPPAQNYSTPTSIPSGALAPRYTPPSGKPVTERQARDADDAYLEGARQLEHDDLAAAEKSFAHAAALDPDKSEYALALSVAHEHRLTELVQQAARARAQGDSARADALLTQARAYDPDNSIITQHFAPDATSLAFAPVDFNKLRANLPPLAGAIHFDPASGKKNLHFRGGAQEVIRQVFAAYGIAVSFDSSFSNGAPIRFDLDDVDFAAATRVLAELTHSIAVPVQPKTALIANNTEDDRDRLLPLVEESVYFPGISADAITELANLARNIFDLRQVTASATGGYILLRGDENTLRRVNEIYTDMVDGGSDVELDIHLYEVDQNHLVNIGAQAPSSISAFPVVSTALNIINQNQSVLATAIASGLLKLTGSAANQELQQLEFLLGTGVVSSSQFSNLLGVVGTFGGLPLLGVSVASTGTFDLLFTSSDVRILDQIQLRAGNNEETSFRAGTRYPIVTATYSSGVSSGLASQLAGVSINGTSAASLLAQYGGTSNVTVPQVQYEDLGITLKTTPRILRSNDVGVKLDLKIEALGGGTINMIPILNNRTLTSNVTVPVGQTALLATNINRNEFRDIAGLPGLSELPGFQGTDKSAEIDSGELLITITPHIVRPQRLRITSRRIRMDHAANSSPQ